jgi:alkanesulfonate monooxygenase SsuD/methylene tetrahydromethanopterin reductase-like flavin-dependent oxidoreductase (luciferase family)
LSLNLFIHGRGHLVATSGFLAAVFDYQDLAQRAEAALFDSIFLADQLALGGHEFFRRRAPGWSRSSFERRFPSDSPSGLIARDSTTYAKP